MYVLNKLQVINVLSLQICICSHLAFILYYQFTYIRIYLLCIGCLMRIYYTDTKQNHANFCDPLLLVISSNEFLYGSKIQIHL